MDATSYALAYLASLCSYVTDLMRRTISLHKKLIAAKESHNMIPPTTLKAARARQHLRPDSVFNYNPIPRGRVEMAVTLAELIDLEEDRITIIHLGIVKGRICG